MFTLTDTGIDASACLARCEDVRAGAIAIFEGRVRNHNEGRAVLSLEYEAYASMAERQGTRILEEAQARFDIFSAVCVHRTGHLRLGDIAVWVGVSAAHRGPAFDATRYIIDQVKARVPIWKKEHYADGDAQWVACTECASHAHSAHPARNA